MPLQSVIEGRPFAQWGLDFVGVINPHLFEGHKFFLTTTDYCTRWVEAVATKNSISAVVIDFLEDNILIRFETPLSLVCNNGLEFQSIDFTDWAYDNHITLRFLSNYYPQGNGLAELTNKNVINTIKKVAKNKPRQWHTLLKYTLWADRTRIKASLKTSPFLLVYG